MKKLQMNTVLKNIFSIEVEIFSFKTHNIKKHKPGQSKKCCLIIVSWFYTFLFYFLTTTERINWREILLEICLTAGGCIQLSTCACHQLLYVSMIKHLKRL